MKNTDNNRNTDELDSISTTTADNIALANLVIDSVGYANAAPTFSVGDGKATTAVGTSNDHGLSVLVQADGKVIVGGDSIAANGKYNFALTRYNSTGLLDSSFNNNGKNTNDFSGFDDTGYAIAVQPADSKILIAGSAGTTSSAVLNTDFALARYYSDGNFEGKVTTAIGTTDVGRAVIAQADGKMVVAGYSDGDFAVVRYNNDGSLDNSFSSDGIVTTDFGSHSTTVPSNGAYAAVLQSDGKLIAVGTNGLDFALARYSVDGSLDATFGNAGKVTTNVVGTDAAYSVALQSDGKLVVAGISNNNSGNGDFSLARYNIDGSLDTSFSGDGLVTTSITNFKDQARSVTVQADGKLLLAGTSGLGDVALVRYNTDGTLDSSFGVNGVVTTAVGSSFDDGYSVTVQNDGKIIVAGDSHNGSNYDFAVVRYNSNGSLDLSFDENANTNTLNATPTYQIGGAAVVLDSTVQVYDPELSVQGHYDGASITLSRHGGADNQDSFAVSGNLSVNGNSEMLLSGVVIGTYSGGIGALAITFNANATQARVNEVLSSIAYSNSGTTSGSVQIDWTFSDGNTGGQGTGGVLTALGATTIAVTSTATHAPFTDFNGDGKSDLQWTNNDGSIRVATLNNLTISGDAVAFNSAATGNGQWQVINSKGDYNGDGKTDLLLWNSVSNSTYMAEMNGTAIATSGFVTHVSALNAGWSIADSTADYNNDGKSDLLLWNSASNTVDIYLQDGLSVLASNRLFADTGAGWEIKSAGGDYNSDGNDDIFFVNQSLSIGFVATMNGVNITGSGYVSIPSGFIVVDSKGDYNGDGKSDILLRDTTSGQLWEYQMDGTTIANGGGAGENVATIGTNFQVISAHNDFNGDGKADILWQNTSDGSAWISLMNGSSITTAGLGASLGVQSGFTVQNADNDVNGDGKADVLWKDANGSYLVMQMDGTTVVSSAIFNSTNAVNHAPTVATALVNQTTIRNVLFSYTVAANSFVDSDAGDVLTYSATLADGSALPAWLSFNSSTLTFSGKSANTSGVLNVKVTATDTANASVSSNFNFTIANASQMPFNDFNGDGKSDLLWTNTNGAAEAWNMNGVTPTAQNTVYAVGGLSQQILNAKGDYDGDGNTDLLRWDGDTAFITEMNASGIKAEGTIAYSAGAGGAGWAIVDSNSDYNNDGKDDILWSNSGSNLLYLGLQDGFNATSGVVTPAISLSGWVIKSAGGDYNGDGNDDILLWNASTSSIYMMTMNGLAISSESFIASGLTGWSVVDGKGDYNADGLSDILLRNDSTGEVWEYQMNGTTITTNATVSTIPNNFQIISAHNDFNADGKSDILWTDVNDNAGWISLLDGTNISSATLGSYPNWSVQNAENDTNGDGKADVLWRNTDGTHFVMELDSSTMIGGSSFGPFAGWSTKSIPAHTDAPLAEVSLIGVQADAAFI